MPSPLVQLPKTALGVVRRSTDFEHVEVACVHFGLQHDHLVLQLRL